MSARLFSIPVIFLLCTAGCSRTDQPLVAPSQVSPVSGSVFDSFPRTTKLVWTHVPGATSYAVEVDPYCGDQWCSEAGASQLVYAAAEIQDTTHTFEHVGAQPGRWRVWAVGRDGKTGPKTDWWQFKYTR